MKYSWIPLCILAAGCGSGSDTAAILISHSDQLIASNMIPDVPVEDRLTQADRKRLERHYPNTLNKIDNHQALSLQDIKNMTRSGLTDNAIIYQIGATNSIFYLTPDDEVELEQAGVSFRVIHAMKNTVGTSY